MRTIIFSLDALAGLIVIFMFALICIQSTNYNLLKDEVTIDKMRISTGIKFYHYAYYLYKDNIISAYNDFNSLSNVPIPEKYCFPMYWIDSYRSFTGYPSFQVRYYCFDYR